MSQVLVKSSMLQEENHLFQVYGSININFSKGCLARTAEEANSIMKILTHELSVLMSDKFKLDLESGGSLELDAHDTYVSIDSVDGDDHQTAYVSREEEMIMLQTQEALEEELQAHMQDLKKNEKSSEKIVDTQKTSLYNEN